MSTLEILLIIAVAGQIPLLVVAVLIQFSRRKAQPSAVSAKPARAEVPVQPQVESIAEAAPVEEAQPELAAESAEAPSIEAEELAAPIEVLAEETAPLPEVEVEAPEAEATIEEPAAAEPVVGEAPPTAPTKAPSRIGLGLRRTRENFLSRIRAAITGSAKLDEIYEGLEEALIGADVGVETSLKIVEQVRSRLKNDGRPEFVREALKEEIERMLLAVERPFADSGDAPLVIIMVGVNGVGKTTTVAKLAGMFKEQGTVLVAAADTFRAAAIEQLEVWCERAGVELIKQKAGSDPAAVAFDAVKAAVARKASAVIVDTAGRLQTKVNLMEELKKIGRVIGRELPGAPHETWLVLDATTGQNALSQAKVFGEATPLTGVVLAKLDGTAKGGVIVAIADRLQLPVRFVGLGESIGDLRPFDAREFVDALFAENDESGEASSTYAA
ncbi:MAG TPA: signal recognition particle-docking protein FtsY [Candidatus Binataceae bacterium]|nr:signal recognition particle-docking protein FtsY [Candidatus Binataceae bacterium]